MRAYHSDPQIKADIIAQLAEHREADKLVKGQYWKNGKGCAVACTVHSSNHMEYERRFGIPVMLARLEDCLFEGMPDEDSQQWPERFMSAIEVGSDLSLVGWKFLHWLLTDETVNPGISHDSVKGAVKECADVVYRLSKGQKIDPQKAWGAASAARATANASWRASWRAARAAASAAESAARAAANAAANASWSAARAAASAASAAESEPRSAAYLKMSDRLIELIEEAAS